MTIGVDGRTPYGAAPEDVARSLDRWGADVIGLNCSVGPQTILECIEKMAPHTRKKLSAQPNAGMPRDVGGRSMYMASPEYMAHVRAAPRAGRREDRRRLLRHDARAHSRDGRGDSAACRRGLGDGGRGMGDGGRATTSSTIPDPASPVPLPPKGVETDSARRALALGQEARGEGVRDVGRDRAAARRRRVADARRTSAASRRPASTRSTCRTVRARRAAWAR